MIWHSSSARPASFVKRHPLLVPLGVFFLLTLLLSLLRGSFMRAKIGVVEVKGVIFNSEAILERIQTLSEDNRVRGVLLRVDSPGGAVGPSQEIFAALNRLRGKKKVFASLGSVAASGGYYVAIGADKIYASPGTLTGSIGVLMESVNAQGLAQKLGLRFETLKAGKNKDIGNSFRPMRPEERSLLESLLQETHRQFLADVLSRRPIEAKLLAEVGDGRVLTGSQAKKLGLIDDLADYKKVEQLLAQELGLKDWDLDRPEESGVAFLKTLQSLTGLDELSARQGIFYLMDWTFK